MKICMDRSECLNWVSVLYLLLVSRYISNHYLDVLWIWIIVILVAGNAKRVYIMKYEYILCYLRRIIYVLPFLYVLGKIKTTIFYVENTYWIILGAGIGISLQITKLKDWFLMWDYEMLRWNQRPSYHYMSAVTMLMLVPIGEEIFYRAYILGQADNVIWGTITSVFLFVLNHIGTKWNSKFSEYDIVVQIIFSIASCCLFLVSKSVIPCIIAHFFYNLPFLIYNIRGYILCKRTD